MNFLHKLISIAIFAAALTSGCRMLPPSKPFLAGEYFHQAEMAGAAEYAPEEYQQLRLEFSELEKLHKEHKYNAVNKRLPLFAEQAEKVIELTRLNISKTEANADSPPLTTVPVAPPPAPIATKTAEIDRNVKPLSSYTVSEGELLWSIAKRAEVYGDPLLWPLLYQANRDQIKDPRQIYAGQTLTIPRNVSEEDREKARNLAKKSDFFSPE